jgi:hypothetical protein
MKKVNLTEKDLKRIVARVIKEQDDMSRMEPTEFNNIRMKVQDFVNDIDLNDTEKFQKTMNYLMESNRDAYNMLKSIGGRGESSIRSLVEILAAMNAIYKTDGF